MNLPPLHPPIATEYQIQGDVVVANDVVMAPGVLLLAEPGSRIVIGAGVCFGMGVLLHARGGTIVVEAGATLGAGVLMVGQGTIGAQACVGTSTTVFEQSVPAGAIIAPGSVVSIHPQALVPGVEQAGRVATPSPVPPVPPGPRPAQPISTPVSPASALNQGFEVWDEPSPRSPAPPPAQPVPLGHPAMASPTAGEPAPGTAAARSGVSGDYSAWGEPSPTASAAHAQPSVDPWTSAADRGATAPPSPPPAAPNVDMGRSPEPFRSEPSPSGTAQAAAAQTRTPPPSPPVPGAAEPRAAANAPPPRISMPQGFQFYSPQQAQSPGDAAAPAQPPPHPSASSYTAGQPSPSTPPPGAADPPPPPEPPAPPEPPPKRPQNHRVYGRDYFLQMRWSMFPNHPPPA